MHGNQNFTSVGGQHFHRAAGELRFVKRGTYVEQGMKVGYVTDYLGNVTFEARAPVAGVVLYVCAVPSMTKGGTIANVGVVAK